MRDSPEVVAAAFTAAGLADGVEDRSRLLLFIDTWFLAAESDLVSTYEVAPLAMPPPGWLPKVTSAPARTWATSLHRTWGALCRAPAPDVYLHPERHTLLPVPGPFIIPGSRFREGYYWDSYWIVRGLLVSGLATMAVSVVDNFAHCLSTYGFVPNGLRSYYLNRSQPPLLAMMVYSVFQATKDMVFLHRVMPAVYKELDWWRTGPRSLTVAGPGGKQYHVSRYYADWVGPRPESHREDRDLAAMCRGTELDADDRQQDVLYRDIASAAESGWDFSSRWFADGRNLDSIQTTRVLPVDLNALLMLAEETASKLAAAVGDEDQMLRWKVCAAQRREALAALHWDVRCGRWRDLCIENMNEPTDNLASSDTCPRPSATVVPLSKASSEGDIAYASDWVPLWCGCAEAGSPVAFAAIASLKRSGLLQPGGIAASTRETGQQWDWPNAWPPLQHMLAEGAEMYGGEEGAEVAENIAHRFLRTAMGAWEKTGRMFEKFDAQEMGVPGGGGEYEVCDGFGWTNGLALVWLEKYAFPEW